MSVPGVTGWNLPQSFFSPGKNLASQFFPHPVSFSPLYFFHPINHMQNIFSRPHNIWNKVDVLPCLDWERMGQPTFPHPLTSNFRFYAYSWQSKVGWVIPHPINHMHKVFPHQITSCTRLMFYLVRVGKEWADPVFPHPLKCKDYIYIHDRIRLAVFFCRRLTICSTVSPHPITFCTRLMFNLVRVGKEWASPLFPHSRTSNFRFYAYSWQGKVGWVNPHPINHMHKVFPHQITFIRLMFYHARVVKELAGLVFPHP